MQDDPCKMRRALLAAALPVALTAASSRIAGATSQVSADPLSSALIAHGPNSARPAGADIFDFATGVWDADYTHLDGGHVTEHYSGEVIFGWIADGWALQDVWIDYPRSTGEARGIGTTIRCFDPTIGLWRVVFVAPKEGQVLTLIGGRVDNRIVLEGSNPDSSQRRWSFNDIQRNSFTWLGERKTPDRDWTINARYRMTRRRQ